MRKNRQAGFTLIEMVATLILVGILAAVAGMGIVEGINGYMFTRNNADTTQRVQFAMSRIGRELLEMRSVSSADANSIAFTSTNWDPLTVNFNAQTINIQFNGVDNKLIDGVNAFTLAYKQADGTAWTLANGFLKLYQVDITITLNRTDTSPITFTTTVNPRNNGTRNSPVASS